MKNRIDIGELLLEIGSGLHGFLLLFKIQSHSLMSSGPTVELSGPASCRAAQFIPTW